MKLVTWQDEDGFIRQVAARDSDSEAVARETGIVHEPPDLSQINWPEVEKELHNLLIRRGIVTWADVQDNQAAFMNAIQSVMKAKIIALFRQKK